MATVYRSNAHSGNWSSDDGTWVTGDGGTTHANHPVAGDTVYLTVNSGNLSVNANSACAILNCTGYAGTLTFTSSYTLTTTGNVTFVSGMTTSGTGTITLKSGSFDFNIIHGQEIIFDGDAVFSIVIIRGGKITYLSGNVIVLDAVVCQPSACTFDTHGAVLWHAIQATGTSLIIKSALTFYTLACSALNVIGSSDNLITIDGNGGITFVRENAVCYYVNFVDCVASNIITNIGGTSTGCLGITNVPFISPTPGRS